MTRQGIGPAFAGAFSKAGRRRCSTMSWLSTCSRSPFPAGNEGAGEEADCPVRGDRPAACGRRGDAKTGRAQRGRRCGAQDRRGDGAPIAGNAAGGPARAFELGGAAGLSSGGDGPFTGRGSARPLPQCEEHADRQRSDVARIRRRGIDACPRSHEARDGAWRDRDHHRPQSSKRRPDAEPGGCEVDARAGRSGAAHESDRARPHHRRLSGDRACALWALCNAH